MAATLRTWWQAQKVRANYGEFAQAALRLGIGIALLAVYYAWVDWSAQTWVRYLCWAFVATSFVLFIWICRSSENSDLIRFLTLAVDVGTPTILLGLTGERSAILVFVYTWVAVGHGFRFGLRYLHIAWIVSLVAFVLVYGLSAAVDGFWYEHPLVWLGALFWIGAPTFYVAQLLKQKLVAVEAAEEARLQVERVQAEADRDRVERARAEAERARAEAEAASEAKSEFLATMSHEMRTPLNGVVGAAELLAEKNLAQSERKLIDWLLASSRQLRSLIDNLLDLRKIEAGKIVIEQAPFDLHVLMNRLAALFEPEAKRARLYFTKSVSIEAPFLLLGDDLRIQQVLINLTSNALKFTREGFVRVSASAVEHNLQRARIRFEVSDTGIGIAPENAGRIFERFVQATPGIHRQFGGSGLGTTISKHLTELMGGEIGFERKPEKGTTFWFTVDLSRQSTDGDEDGGGLLISDINLFLVSNRSNVRARIATVAGQQRWKWSAVNSIEAAIAAGRQDNPLELQVVIVDGQDESHRWRDIPSTIRKTDLQWPFLLIHPLANETDAFDAGYSCVLRTADALLVLKAIRSLVAGTSTLQPIEDLSGPQGAVRIGLRILVAEDNQISQQIIAMMLKSGGHHVTLVSDGESVLENFHNVAFDVMILDMHMPGRTGLEVARSIRLLESKGRNRRMPIIMLTAAASTDLREDSLDAGVDLFLSKPIDPRALLRGVQRLSSSVAARAEVPPLKTSSSRPQEYIDRVLLQDMAYLARDSEFIRTLSAQFAHDGRELISRMEAAFAAKNYVQFRELAHALKGSAMMAGAIQLRDSAAQIEMITESDFSNLEIESIDELKRTLEATSHQLTRMVA